MVLLDLGIARRLDGHALTHAGSILGTPSYMSPEQAQGQLDVGPPADVFSLGCVLHECLVGEPPFVGNHVFAVLAKVLFEEPPALRQLRPEHPEAVEALLARLLAKDPRARPPDAAAVVAALAELGSFPEEAPPSIPVASAPVSTREQILMSVILATRGQRPASLAEASGSSISEAGPPSFPELTAYGGEFRHLADGTTLIVLPQGGGAANDLAVRAARCALRLRESLPPTWKIVLTTGRGVERERLHVGDAVDRAGHLLAARGEEAVGAIWIDDVTAGLLDARFRSRRNQLGSYVLEGEELTTDPTRPLLGRPTACVGREHELGTLELTWRACKEEESPRALLVVGQAGMGKSRLRHEFLRRTAAHGEELLVLFGRGDPIRASGTSGLLGGALARLCGIHPGAGDDENRAALERRVARNLPEEGRRRVVSFLGTLAGLSYPADFLAELTTALQEPRIMRDQLARAWIDFLRAETALQPVLLILDDLQWGDAPTVELVEVALRELHERSFMLLALGRPEVHELFPSLWKAHLSVLRLRPLPAGAIARLVRQVLDGDLAEASVAGIVTRAAGNALYVEELIRAAAARRESAPETVVAMLQSRIGLLGPTDRRVLRAAAVFGETFPLGGVEHLLAYAGTPPELEPSLARLAGQEILEREPESEAGRRWRFRHVLMRDAAYGLLTAEDQIASHAQAARHLVGVGENDDAVIASHFERGGEPVAAVRYYTRAAERSFHRADHKGSLEMVRRGLAAGATGEARGVLRGIEAPAQYYVHDFAAAFAASGESLGLLPPGHSLRVLALATHSLSGTQLGRLGELGPLVDEMLASQPGEHDLGDYASALGHASIAYGVTGGREPAARLVARLAEFAPRTRPDDAYVRGQIAYWQLRHIEVLGDDHHAPWLLAQEAVLQCRRSGDRRILVNSLIEQGECARRLYSLEEGKRAMRESVALVEPMPEPITYAFMRQYLATLLAEHGRDDELDEARELARAVDELAGHVDAYRALGLIPVALLALRDGDLDQAEAVAREAHAGMHSLGIEGLFPHVDRTLLLVLTARRVAEAGGLADEALAHVRRRGPFGLMELPLRLAAAEAHAAVGRLDAALTGVVEAMMVLRRRQARIPDPHMQRQFATDIPEHARLIRLAGEWGAG